MIIEAFVAHILGSLYFTNRKQSHYESGIFFFFVTVLLLKEFPDVLEWSILSLGLILWHSLYQETLKKTLVPFFTSVETNNHNPLYDLYTQNKESILFILEHMFYILVIFLLDAGIQNFNNTVHLAFAAALFLIFLVKKARKLRKHPLNQALQEGASLFILVAITVFVSQLIMNGIDVFQPFLYVPHIIGAQSAYFIWLRSLFILLLLMRPANLVIRTLSSKYDPKIHDKLSLEEYEFKSVNSKQESGFKGAGAMIGNLERLLILLSFFSGSLLSVVAILSIKAFARYKLIAEDPYFSEYFVIGTMLSVLLTFGCYLLFLFMMV